MASTGTAPQTFRARQVARAPERNLYLKVLSPAERRKFSPLLSASLGTVVVAGFTAPAMAQSNEQCAFVYQLRSPYTVERVLRNFPNDPCIPVMLDAISPSLLTRIDVNLVASLPPGQLRKVSPETLQELGITTAKTEPTTTRAVPRTTYRPRTPKPGY